jgi:hypothetical protein
MLYHDTFFITADKLRLNELSQSTTHLSCVKPLSPPPNNMEHRVTSTSAYLNFFKSYWLPSFASSPGQLKRQVNCDMPAIAKRRLMQVMEQLGSASDHPIQFFGCHERLSTGDWLQSVHRGRNSTPPRRPWGCAIPLCETWGKWPWRFTSMNDGTIWMLRFGNRKNGSSEKFVKILKQKIY